MRIGFFTDGYLPQINGVATSVFESARELERRGHEVFIIAPKYPGYIDKNPRVIRLTSLKVVKQPEIRMALNLPDKSLRKIIAMDFDIIHGHSGGPVTLLGWEIARSKKIPFVCTYHTLWNRYTHYFLKGKIVTPRMMERATKIFGNRIDYLIAPTTRVEKELRSYGVRKPIKVVPSGIEIEKFENAKPGVLRNLTHFKKEPILLYVGRLGREKSVNFIIRSFKDVLENSKKAKLVIVGEGPERKNLENLAKRLKVDTSTYFLGHIDAENIHEIYKDADVFVFSSKTETQGLVVPEALASGVPVVAVDDPALECVESGKNGYLVKKDNKDFALKVLSVLENSPLKEEFSKNAVLSSKKFSVKATVDALEGVYFGLLEKYNKESVSMIMGQNRRSEEVFVVHVSYWAAVLLARTSSYLSYSPQGAYPKFVLGGQEFFHSAFGLLLFLFALSIIFKNRRAGVIPLVLLGLGTGFIIDELWAFIFFHNSVLDYWNILNIIPILIVGVAPVFFAKVKIVDRPKFYINIKELKHTNPESPRVSVVVPAYNEEEFIATTLKSLINQTYKDFELIVVDNNSTDNTADVARNYGARVVHEPQKGVAAARQAGFAAARGEIIATTDADSVVPDNWLSRIVEGFEKNEKLVGFGGTGHLYSGPVTARAAGRYIFPIFLQIDKILSGGWNLIGFNMAVRKHAFIQIGGFKTDLTLGEDVDLAARLRTVGKVEVDSNLLVYVSGRRYRSGLLIGILTYAPSWFMRVVFKKEKFLTFPAVRSEKLITSRLTYLPLSAIIVFIVILFYFSNPDLVDKFKLF